MTAIAKRDHTARSCSAAIGINIKSVRTALEGARRQKSIHIASWDSSRSRRPVAVYRYGPGVDAAYPVANRRNDQLPVKFVPARDKLMDLLASKECTAAECGAEIGITVSAASRLLSELHAETPKKVYVCAWSRIGPRQASRIFKAGAGVDAERPGPLTDAERQEKRRKKQRKTGLSNAYARPISLVLSALEQGDLTATEIRARTLVSATQIYLVIGRLIEEGRIHVCGQRQTTKNIARVFRLGPDIADRSSVQEASEIRFRTALENVRDDERDGLLIGLAKALEDGKVNWLSCGARILMVELSDAKHPEEKLSPPRSGSGWRGFKNGMAFDSFDLRKPRQTDLPAEICKLMAEPVSQKTTREQVDELERAYNEALRGDDLDAMDAAQDAFLAAQEQLFCQPA